MIDTLDSKTKRHLTLASVFIILIFVLFSTSVSFGESQRQQCLSYYSGSEKSVLLGVSPSVGIYTGQEIELTSVKKAISSVNTAIALSYNSHKKLSAFNSRNLVVINEQREQLPSSFSEYEKARFVVADQVIEAPKGTILYKDVQFGYKGVKKTGPYLEKIKKLGFKNFGTLTYLLADSQTGKILEVGGMNKDLLNEFKLHLKGREVNQKELLRYSEVYKKMIQHFQRQEEGRAILEEFNTNRGWPKGFAENAGFFYLESVQKLIAWAKQNEIAPEELIRMGVVRRNFAKIGTPYEYTMICSHSILIPYFTASGDVVKIKARQLKKATTGKKYLDFSEDRSITNGNQLSRRLFNSEVLKHIEGKPVIITEGEIKSLIATRIGKVDTVAIPGISQFEDDMAHALVAAKASEYIVVLDRDPKGKALMNLDNLTDSQRAAYAIAAKLEEAGAPIVKVGVIPDTRQTGSKVGLDDLILMDGPGSLSDLVKNARTLDAYAQEVKIDRKIAELLTIQTVLVQTLRGAHLAMKLGLDTVNGNDVKLLENFKNRIDSDFETHLNANYPGYKNIRQPAFGYKYIPQQQGEKIQPGKFKGQIENSDLIFGRKDFMNAILLFDIINSNPKSKKTESTMEPHQISDAQLRITFPKEEYGFLENVTLTKSYFGQTKTIVIPLMIYRLESKKVVALARPEEMTEQEFAGWDSVSLFIRE